MRIFYALFLLCATLPGIASAEGPVLPPGTRFILSHFKSNASGGDERLHISVSPDALNWTALNGGNPVWQPPGWQPFGNVVRDPTIIHHNGWFWVAYTSGNYGHHASFGLVKSRDLLTWSFVGEIPTTLPNTTDPLTWNPCFFRDGDGSVHVFVSISPTGGSQYNPIPAMRTYEMHPLNAEWTQWSAPAAVELPSTNTNEFWAWKEGDTYHAVYVDFNYASYWKHATSRNLLTGWKDLQVVNAPGEEGGFVLKKPDGGYRFFVEPGNGKGAQATYRWRDFNSTFTSWTQQQAVRSDIGLRNGKIIAAPAITTYSEWQAERLSGQAVTERGPTADPDGDGLVNLLECASDLDPLTPTTARTSSAVIESNGDTGWALSLRFRRVPRLADVSYRVEVSSDLARWNSDPAAVAIQSATLLTDGAEEVLARHLAPDGATRFMRLKVEQIAPPTLQAQTPQPVIKRRAARSIRRTR